MMYLYLFASQSHHYILYGIETLAMASNLASLLLVAMAFVTNSNALVSTSFLLLLVRHLLLLAWHLLLVRHLFLPC